MLPELQSAPEDQGKKDKVKRRETLSHAPTSPSTHLLEAVLLPLYLGICAWAPSREDISL